MELSQYVVDYSRREWCFYGAGVHGQSLYIDPRADMVIARFASYPVAGNAANDPTTLPAYQAVADYLIKLDRAYG
jgi:CubicO group peptidase (beta-lactamase class C family)